MWTKNRDGYGQSEEELQMEELSISRRWRNIAGRAACLWSEFVTIAKFVVEVLARAKHAVKSSQWCGWAMHMSQSGCAVDLSTY